MNVTMSLSQGDLAADVLRDAIEAEAFAVEQRMRVAYPDNLAWHEGAEAAMVDGAVRLHRMASILQAMDQAWGHVDYSAFEEAVA